MCFLEMVIMEPIVIMIMEQVLFQQKPETLYRIYVFIKQNEILLFVGLWAQGVFGQFDVVTTTVLQILVCHRWHWSCGKIDTFVLK